MSTGSLDVPGTESKRKSRGRSREEGTFPVPAGKTEMPAEYAAVLGELKKRIHSERLRVTLAANSAMVLMYWDLGKVILNRQERQGWRAKVIDRLSYDLKTAFLDMSGFSPRNLKYMRTFAEAWPEREIVQRTVVLIPWRSNLALLDKLEDLNAGAAVLAATINKNFEEVGV